MDAGFHVLGGLDLVQLPLQFFIVDAVRRTGFLSDAHPSGCKGTSLTALLLIASLTFASEVDLAVSSAVGYPMHRFQPRSARLAPNPIPLVCS
jgi:hypothetical protein